MSFAAILSHRDGKPRHPKRYISKRWKKFKQTISAPFTGLLNISTAFQVPKRWKKNKNKSESIGATLASTSSSFSSTSSTPTITPAIQVKKWTFFLSTAQTDSTQPKISNALLSVCRCSPPPSSPNLTPPTSASSSAHIMPSLSTYSKTKTLLYVHKSTQTAPSDRLSQDMTLYFTTTTTTTATATTVQHNPSSQKNTSPKKDDIIRRVPTESSITRSRQPSEIQVIDVNSNQSLAVSRKVNASSTHTKNETPLDALLIKHQIQSSLVKARLKRIQEKSQDNQSIPASSIPHTNSYAIEQHVEDLLPGAWIWGLE